MFISHLEHASFNSSETSSVISLHLPIKSIVPQDLGSPLSDVSNISEERSSTLSDNSHDRSATEKTGPALNGVLSSEDASRAVYALSSAVDNLFDCAATTLGLESFKSFLVELIKASHQQLFGRDNKFPPLDPSIPQDNAAIQQQMITMNTLHLYHICDVMVRCARNNNRPLLHVMSAWSIIAQHLVEVSKIKKSTFVTFRLAKYIFQSNQAFKTRRRPKYRFKQRL